MNAPKNSLGVTQVTYIKVAMVRIGTVICTFIIINKNIRALHRQARRKPKYGHVKFHEYYSRIQKKHYIFRFNKILCPEITLPN